MTGSVIVSGGTYGIGRAITLELARRGWRVVAFGLDTPQPGSAAADGRAGTRDALTRAGLQAELLEADVRAPDDVARVVACARAQPGGVAALVNNAAIRPTGTLLDIDESGLERVLAVNLVGAYRLSRVVVPLLRDRGGGAIVNVGSGAAAGKPGLAAYAASKGGLHALSAALAHDHRADGIRVNLVVPAPGTPSGMVPAPADAPADGAAGPGAPPRALDVARAVAFLLSDDAATLSGAVLELGRART